MNYLDKTGIHLYGDTPEEAVDSYSQHPPRELAELIVNHYLNGFISSRSETAFDSGENEPPIPYHGWFWRNVDFFSPGGVTVARGEGRVAICQSNKWGYPERDLTAEEQQAFLALVWTAYTRRSAGGNLADLERNARADLEKAGEFIANLDGPFEGWD